MNNQPSSSALLTGTVLVLSVALPVGFIVVAYTWLTPLWQLMSIIFASGALGGVVNALLTDNGFALPGRKIVGSVIIVQPGFFGNLLIGATAATASWGLYGTFAQQAIVSRSLTPIVTVPQVTAGQTAAMTLDLPLSALISAFIIGVGGARWLTAEVDKKVLTAAASKAASAQPDPGAAQRMQASSPAGILEIASSLK